MEPARGALLRPWLLLQALGVRLSTPRLEEPAGPRHGHAGAGPPCSLLVLGDSSAAGVGVSHQESALAQPLARHLAQIAHRRIDWRLIAARGLNTIEVLNAWQRAGCPGADLVVVVSGVNDVIDRLGTEAVARARQVLCDAMLSTGRARHLAFTPPPPMHLFAALPEPLRSHAGASAHRHGEALRRWQSSRAGTSIASLPFSPTAGMLADDGFHPGSAAYAAWALALARHLAAFLRPAAGGAASRDAAPSLPGP